MEIRRMLVDNYSVFHTIRGDKVIVTDVLYTASDIEARLRGVKDIFEARDYLNLRR